MSDLNVLPRVCREVVDSYFIRAVSLLEATEDNHLGSVDIKGTGVLVSQENLVASGSTGGPAHRAQVKVVKSVSVDFLCLFLFVG